MSLWSGRAVSLPSSPAPSTRAQLITTETVRKRQCSNPQIAASSSSSGDTNSTAATSSQQPDSATKSTGKFTILQPKDQPLNPLRLHQDRLETACLPTVNENDNEILKARSDDHDNDMFPDTTTKDSCLIQVDKILTFSEWFWYTFYRIRVATLYAQSMIK